MAPDCAEKLRVPPLRCGWRASRWAPLTSPRIANKCRAFPDFLLDTPNDLVTVACIGPPKFILYVLRVIF